MTELLHATVTGAGPVVATGHSLGATHAMWGPQIPALESAHRLVNLDLRGHGDSPAPPGPYRIDDLGADVLATLDQLSVGRFSWVGLSLGGMIGMWLASEVPDRVERLVLVCTAARLGPPEGWTERAATVREHGCAAVAEAVVARWFTDDYAARHPDEIARQIEVISATPAEGYAGCCEAISEMDLTDRLPRITAPTLVVVGESDPVATVEHAEVIRSGIPDCRLDVVGPAAHLASVEAAAAVTDLIAGALRG